jgi:hypothetical protein
MPVNQFPISYRFLFCGIFIATNCWQLDGRCSLLGTRRFFLFTSTFRPLRHLVIFPDGKAFNIAETLAEIRSMCLPSAVRPVVYYEATATSRLPARPAWLTAKRYQQLRLKLFTQRCSYVQRRFKYCLLLCVDMVPYIFELLVSLYETYVKCDKLVGHYPSYIFN